MMTPDQLTLLTPEEREDYEAAGTSKYWQYKDLLDARKERRAALEEIARLRGLVEEAGGELRRLAIGDTHDNDLYCKICFAREKNGRFTHADTCLLARLAQGKDGAR